MPRLFVSALMCLIGVAAGLLIPSLAEKVAIYKLKQKGMDKNSDSTLTAKIKAAVTVFNAALWTFAGICSVSLVNAVSISILFTFAILISVIDMEIRLIPNELLLAMIAAGVFYQCAFFGFRFLMSSVFIMLGMMFFFTIVAGFTGFGKVGAGDVKLAGAMGFVLGYPGILTALAAMSAGLIIYSVTGILSKKLTLKSAFPFAPFMMLGMAASLLRIGLSGF